MHECDVPKNPRFLMELVTRPLWNLLSPNHHLPRLSWYLLLHQELLNQVLKHECFVSIGQR
uniref:ORF60f n=1 Tax=Pinus koraiensis TaxID=88728 RepID=Q85WX1_PINKO|nr:ORF60f [Pinus koraiensis]